MHVGWRQCVVHECMCVYTHHLSGDVNCLRRFGSPGWWLASQGAYHVVHANFVICIDAHLQELPTSAATAAAAAWDSHLLQIMSETAANAETLIFMAVATASAPICLVPTRLQCVFESALAADWSGALPTNGALMHHCCLLRTACS